MPQNDQHPDSAEASTPLGSFKLKGENTPLVLLVGSCVLGVAYLIWNADNRTNGEHKEIADRLDSVIYMLSLPDEDRQRLRLHMPQNLRKSIRREKEDDSR